MDDKKTAVRQGQDLARKAGEFVIGNDLLVTRTGFGAMRITGKGIWGEPTGRAACVRVLRRAVELGINFIGQNFPLHSAVCEEERIEIQNKAKTGKTILVENGTDTRIKLRRPRRGYRKGAIHQNAQLLSEHRLRSLSLATDLAALDSVGSISADDRRW